jgi:hypothetical protein
VVFVGDSKLKVGLEMVDLRSEGFVRKLVDDVESEHLGFVSNKRV